MNRHDVKVFLNLVKTVGFGSKHEELKHCAGHMMSYWVVEGIEESSAYSLVKRFSALKFPLKNF